MTVVRLKMILYYEVLQICIFVIGVVLKYDGVFFRISAMSNLMALWYPRFIAELLSLYSEFNWRSRNL